MLNRPWHIGNVKIDNPLVLSPMEAVNDIAFRQLCKKYGAGLVSTEMVSVNSLVRLIPAALDLVQVHPDEHPVSTQLFGTDPTTCAQAAQILEGSFETDQDISRVKTDIVDLNVGCPAPRILAMGAGCALHKDLDALRSICSEITNSIDIPFTLKMRIGLSDNQLTYKQIVNICNETDVAAIKVHGRTMKQGYSGKANWDIIKEIKQMSSVPVIGNGDVFDEKSAEKMFTESGVDAIMIGRGALGNPSIFKRILHYFDTREILPQPSKLEQMEMFSEYLSFAKQYDLREARLRQQGLYFVRGFDGATHLRGILSRCKSIEEMEDALFGNMKEIHSEIPLKKGISGAPNDVMPL